LATTLALAQPDDVLELDELWSFVARRKNKRWIWLAQCRRTRQIVAYAIGCRGEATCRLLWERVPAVYKSGLLFTDFWSAYADVLPEAQHQARGPASGPRPSIRPEAQHQATGKGDGQTCHIERFNNILRQRMGRLVRRTLSFSKTDEWHGWCLHLFLHEYNKNKLN